MEKIIKIPSDINVILSNFKVSVKGKLGELERDFFSPLFAKQIILESFDNKIILKTDSKKRKIKSMVGCIESHIKNMFKGVTDGFTYKLKIVYMHFPVTVKVSGDKILISNFLGEKTPRKSKIVGNCKVEVKGDDVIVSGTDKELAGQTAANIERACAIKGYDRRVFQDAIVIVEKP